MVSNHTSYLCLRLCGSCAALQGNLGQVQPSMPAKHIVHAGAASAIIKKQRSICVVLWPQLARAPHLQDDLLACLVLAKQVIWIAAW
jgi:hypothetical protein